jgi:hypothetical protein
MRTCSSRGGWAILLAVGLLAFLPTSARAQPALIGRWVGTAPPAPPVLPGPPPPQVQPAQPRIIYEYDLGPGEYFGNWVWRGCFTFSVDNFAVSTGTYQLRMFNGVEGTLELRDFNGLAHAVANVDLGARLMNFKNVIFRPQ